MASSVYLNEALQSVLSGFESTLQADKPIHILEAGCGSLQHIDLPRAKRVVGIDVDPEQLAHNTLLDEKILGDLHTYEFLPKSFDLIVCVDVLEHLSSPEKALENMTSSLKDGGFFLFAVPEPYSFKGFLAKYTPTALHGILYRILTGRDVEFVDGLHKTFFPTFLRPLCSLRRFVFWARRHHFEVVFKRAYDGHSQGIHPRYRFFVKTARFVSRLTELLTRGRVNLLEADYVLLLRKESSAGRPASREVSV